MGAEQGYTANGGARLSPPRRTLAQGCNNRRTGYNLSTLARTVTFWYRRRLRGESALLLSVVAALSSQTGAHEKLGTSAYH